MKKGLLIGVIIIIITICFGNIRIFANDNWDGTWDGSYIYVATRYVNVREAPSTNSRVVGALVKNMIIPGGLENQGWIPVNYKGIRRYVYSAYLIQTAKPIALSQSTTYIATCRTTGYDLCMRCCGKAPGSYGYGITASGTYAQANRTVGMKGYPYGSRIYIEGLGYYIVEDTGYIGYNHVDIYCNNHSECYKLPQYANVYLVK